MYRSLASFQNCWKRYLPRFWWWYWWRCWYDYIISYIYSACCKAFCQPQSVSYSQFINEVLVISSGLRRGHFLYSSMFASWITIETIINFNSHCSKPTGLVTLQDISSFICKKEPKVRCFCYLYSVCQNSFVFLYVSLLRQASLGSRKRNSKQYLTSSRMGSFDYNPYFIVKCMLKLVIGVSPWHLGKVILTQHPFSSVTSTWQPQELMWFLCLLNKTSWSFKKAKGSEEQLMIH